MIYLDHAAATPVSKKALEAMMPFFDVEFFNPSAAYLPAKKVRDSYEAAKSDLAHTIGAKSADLIITAGATEANNLAFTAVSVETDAAVSAKQNMAMSTKTGRANAKLLNSPASSTLETQTKILYLETEHASVRNLAQSLGGQAVKIVPRNGRIDLADLKSKITAESIDCHRFDLIIIFSGRNTDAVFDICKDTKNIPEQLSFI